MYIHNDVTFLIIGKHIHSGELCHPIGKDKNGITQHFIHAIEMYEVALDDCPHGIAKCFVTKDDLQLVSNNRKE